MKAIKALILMAFIVLLIHIVSALTLDRRIEYKDVPFASAKVPAQMDGYTIAFISDTHAISAQELRAVVQKLNETSVDLLILGGDFPSHGDAPERTMDILSKAVATDGIYGVEGNHDEHIPLFAAMRRHSIHPLSNSGVRIRENFYLAGVEDLWNRKPDIRKAVEGAEPEDFVLLISHNPDLAMLQDTASVDLILEPVQILC